MSLIVLEGLDGSGKGTQTALLAEALVKQGRSLRQITFPDYDSPSSALVRMYLNGEFGTDPEDVNPYAASAFYAVDRFASFRKDWKKDYDQGSVILCDRYATSNMVYQMGKSPRKEWDRYLEWVEDFEYGKLGLPRPDLVLYLDMPVEVSQKLLLQRYHGDSGKKRYPLKPLGVPAFLRGMRPLRGRKAPLESGALLHGWATPSGGRDTQVCIGTGRTSFGCAGKLKGKSKVEPNRERNLIVELGLRGLLRDPLWFLSLAISF